MTAERLLDALQVAGLSISLTTEQLLLVTPASKLTDELRALIRANKPELVALLASPEPPPAPDWKALDVAYQRHHLACPVCIAAGKGYGLRCGTGAALWAGYQAATP